MWSEKEIKTIKRSLVHFCRMWEATIDHPLPDWMPHEVTYSIDEAKQEIKFQVRRYNDIGLKDDYLQEITAYCNCDSPMSVIKDCQKAFEKVFMNKDKGEE